MMGRIRSIKPEILTDEKTAALSDHDWRLFVSMFVMADDYGNLRASPGFAHSQAFWGTEATVQDSRKSLERLAKLSLIRLYEVHGQQYAHIVNWDKHQKVDHPGKPICPGEEHGVAHTCDESSREVRETVAKAPETVAPDQEVEVEVDRSDSSELSRTKPPEPTEPALIEFPCAKGETWHLTETIRREMAEAYPAVDVLACARKALEWLRSHPRNLKTRPRMRGWIGSVWCGRQQDKQTALPIAAKPETLRWHTATDTP
jgi:hypothetical protein